MTHTEVWFSFKEVVVDETETRFVTPHLDRMLYEYPFDYRFETAYEALKFIVEHADDTGITEEEYNNWVLVRARYTQYGAGLVKELLADA